MKISVQATIILLLSLCCSCCIVPVPHRRVHAYGVEGQIVSAADNTPIPFASISSVDHLTPSTYSDGEGRFRLRPHYGWHGAYFIGVISQSMLPGFDMTPSFRDIHVFAPGYRSADFRVCAQIVGAFLEARQLQLVPATSPSADANHTVEPTRAPEGARGSP